MLSHVFQRAQGYEEKGGLRRVPLEIRAEGDDSITYEESLEEQGRFKAKPVLPFRYRIFRSILIAVCKFSRLVVPHPHSSRAVRAAPPSNMAFVQCVRRALQLDCGSFSNSRTALILTDILFPVVCSCAPARRSSYGTLAYNHPSGESNGASSQVSARAVTFHTATAATLADDCCHAQHQRHASLPWAPLHC
jgi:hypothetical protein